MGGNPPGELEKLRINTLLVGWLLALDKGAGGVLPSFSPLE